MTRLCKAKAAPTRSVNASRGYQRLAPRLNVFRQIPPESVHCRGFISLMKSGVYRSFELCLSQIKQAI
jgi:hypothetical protein